MYRPAQLGDLCVPGNILVFVFTVCTCEWKCHGIYILVIFVDDSINMTADKIDLIDLTETDDEQSPIKKRPLLDNTAVMNKASQPMVSNFKRCGAW